MKFLIWLGCALIYGLVNALCKTLDLHPGGFGTLIIAGICIALAVYWCKIYDANHPADDSDEESPSATDQVPASPAAEDVPACTEPTEQKPQTVVTVHRKVIPPKEKIEEIVPAPSNAPTKKDHNLYKLLFWISVVVCLFLAVGLVVTLIFSNNRADDEDTVQPYGTPTLYSDCGGGTVSLSVTAPSTANCYYFFCPSTEIEESSFSVSDRLYYRYMHGGIRLYLPAGDTISFQAPACDYELYVITGSTWLNEAELFSEDTCIRKYDSILTFTDDAEFSISPDLYDLQSDHFSYIPVESRPDYFLHD